MRSNRFLLIAACVSVLCLGMSTDLYGDIINHWKLDEAAGLDVADSSGYDNYGTPVGMGGPEWTAGILDGALETASGSSANLRCVLFKDLSSLQLLTTQPFPHGSR